MIIDPIEAETEVNWKMKPKTHKRKCMFLYDSDVLYLPESRETTKDISLGTSQVLHKEINVEPTNINKNDQILNQDVVSTLKDSRELTVNTQENGLAIKLSDDGFDKRKKTDMMSFVYVIIGFIHILMNVFMLGVLTYTVGYVLYFATVDITYKIKENRESISIAIEEAKKQYKINRCDPTTRVPALEKQCSEWNYLISNGFNGIKYTKIVVEMLADVLDGFVSKFKLRNIFTLTLIFVVYLMFRNKK